MDRRPAQADIWPTAAPTSSIGVGLAIAAGVVLGVVIGWYRRLAMVFEPFLNALYATPRVALVPLILIWFGIGMWSKVFIVFINAFFPVLINTIGGIRAIDADLLRAARAFCASDWQIFTTVAIPGAVPFILTGVRQAVALGLIGVVVGEMFGGSAGHRLHGQLRRADVPDRHRVSRRVIIASPDHRVISGPGKHFSLERERYVPEAGLGAVGLASGRRWRVQETLMAEIVLGIGVLARAAAVHPAGAMGPARESRPREQGTLVSRQDLRLRIAVEGARAGVRERDHGGCQARAVHAVPARAGDARKEVQRHQPRRRRHPWQRPARVFQRGPDARHHGVSRRRDQKRAAPARRSAGPQYRGAGELAGRRRDVPGRDGARRPHPRLARRRELRPGAVRRHAERGASRRHPARVRFPVSLDSAGPDAASVPIILNVHFPRNTPKLGRCLELGRALYRAITSFKGFNRVALIASGGLTHFVIDEDLDQTIMAAMRKGDEHALAALPENLFKVGTAEIKNWYPVIAAMNAAGRTYHQVDYVPCYRSEAGTGNAMCFAYWE